MKYIKCYRYLPNQLTNLSDINNQSKQTGKTIIIIILRLNKKILWLPEEIDGGQGKEEWGKVGNTGGMHIDEA